MDLGTGTFLNCGYGDGDGDENRYLGIYRGKGTDIKVATHAGMGPSMSTFLNYRYGMDTIVP